MQPKIFFLSLLFITIAFCGAITFAQEFDPENIISDEEFRDITSTTFDELKTFLETREGCLKQENLSQQFDFSYPAYPYFYNYVLSNGKLGRECSPTEIIFYSATDPQNPPNHVNPKVLIALLQKEQSLIDIANRCTQSVLDLATGYKRSDDTYKGFFNQVLSAAYELTQDFEKRTAGIQPPIQVDSGSGSITITPKNRATAALYEYNPSVTGNRNFWEIYNNFFDLKTMGDPFGTDVGSFNGVTAYSNGTTDNVSNEYNSVGGQTTGMKWQCVEYVNRYYTIIYNKALYNTGIYGDAKTYYERANLAGLDAFPNGGPEIPKVGDIFCSNGGDYGHIAIVRSVSSNEVQVIQQNWSNTNADNNKTLSLSVSNGNYTVGGFSSNYPVQGWLRMPGTQQNDELLVKGSSPDIHLLKNNILHRLTDWDQIYLPLKDMYGDFIQKNDSELEQYFQGSQIIADGLVCQHQWDYDHNGPVYLIQYDQKRHFVDEAAYTQRGYQLSGGDPISPTVVRLPDGMLDGYASGPDVTTSGVQVTADLFFKKGTQRENTFSAGDTKSSFIELTNGDGYTSFFYLRITKPDGSKVYAFYTDPNDIPDTPFQESTIKVPFLRENDRPKTFNIAPGNWNQPWNFNNYTIQPTTQPGTHTWEYWYEDVNKPGVVLGKDTESYTVVTQNEVTVTVESTPTGRNVQIDNQTYTTPATFTWTIGSQHIISTNQTQSGGTGVRYVFTQWSDGGVRTHLVTASAATTTYTANFSTNYYLTTSVSPVGAGTISPASGWYSSGTNLQFNAQPTTGSNYSFSYWSGDLSGNQNPASLLMNAPKTVQANFIITPPRQITITSIPTGLTATVDGTQYATPHSFNWQAGEQHSIGVNQTEIFGTGARYAFESWSDGGARVHTITIASQDATYTANFVTEYQLTTVNNPQDGGSILIDPPGDWFVNGTYVTLTAQANSNYSFSHWSGSESGSSNPISVRIDAAKNVVANYQATGASQVLVRFPTGLTAAPASTVEIPILIQTDVTAMGIISYQFTLNYNSSVLSATGVNSVGAMTNSWQPAVVNTMTSGEVQVGGYGTSELTGTGILSKVVFDVVGAHGSQSTLQLTEFIFNSGTPTADVQDGTFQVEVDPPDISGYVYYHGGSSPVQYVTMSITGGGATETTKADGSYEFLDLTLGGNYTITPSMTRFAHLTPNCIHASDASLAAHAVFGLEQLTTIQQLAADVDRNGELQMYDAALMMYAAVVGPPLSADSYVGEWEFESPSRSYTNLLSDRTYQNYEAIVLGDVNADWPNPPGLAKASMTLFSLGDLIRLEPGHEFSLTLPNNSGQLVLTAFAKIKYDPKAISLKQIGKTSQTQDFMLFQKHEEGSITCGVLALKPTVINEGILKAVFVAKDVQGATTIEVSELTINSEPASQAAQDVLIGNDAPVIKSFTVYQNYPNPFNPETTIRYSLPWNSPRSTSVVIFDVRGRLIRSILSAQQAAGEYTVTWDGLDANGLEAPSGVYLFSLRSGEMKKNIKMLKIK